MFSALSVSEKLVYRFRFLALCWLACFSNIRFMPLFTLWVGTTPVPVFLWLESHVGWTEILVLILKKIQALFSHFHCCYTTQGRKHPLPLLLVEKSFDVNVSTPTKSHLHKFHYCDLFLMMPSALAKFAKVKFTQNIIALWYAYLLIMLGFSFHFLHMGSIDCLIKLQR